MPKNQAALPGVAGTAVETPQDIARLANSFGSQFHAFKRMGSGWLVKRILSIVGTLSLCVMANGQARLIGKVLDKESGLPKEGVTVQIGAVEHETAVFTDKRGYFSAELLRNVEYTLVFSAIDANSHQTTIKTEKDTSIKVTLTPNSIELKEIHVEARKKLLESRIDRLVYNVGNDPLAKTLNTEELVKRIPLLRIRDNSLTVIGKGSVVVSVNGKVQQINAGELLPFLNNFDPENLKSIEVITTPPPNFSAAGKAGIINIVTKRTTASNGRNWNASVRSAYTQRSLPGTDNGMSFNYGWGRLSASTNINYTLTQLRADLSAGGNGIEEHTDRKDKGNRVGAYLNLNYRPSDRHDISGSFSHYNSLHENTYTNRRRSSDLFSTVGDRKNDQSRFSADLNHEFKPTGAGKSITTFVSYNANAPEEIFYAQTNDGTGSPTGILTSLSRLDNKAFSVQVDAHSPYPFGELDYGIQYYSLGNNANLGYVSDTEKTDENHLYSEHNYAGYASFAARDMGKFRFKAGVRYEHNDADLKSVNGNIGSPRRKNGKLFPTVYALYSIDDGSRLSANYTKRINRPGFNAISPFRWYNNIYSYVTGNPLLRPFISDNVQLNYEKGDVHVSLYGQFSKNGYGEVDIFDNTRWISSYQNFFDQNRFGMVASYFVGLLKWWEADLYGSAYFNETNSNVPDIEDRSGYALTYELTNRFFLDGKKRHMMSLNYWQDLPFYDNNVYNRSFGSLDFAINVSLLDQKLNLGLLVTDLGHQSITRTRSDYARYSVHRREYFEARTYRASLRYSLGSSSVKTVRKTDKFQDRERVN